MILVGLTGSIGMGKSTTASMFKEYNYAVYNADDTVHYVYENDPIIIEKINQVFPGSKAEGKVNRVFLRNELNKYPKKFKDLEIIIHPALRQYQISFIKTKIEEGKFGCILDIPLLFETGGEKYVDTTIVVCASEKKQYERVVEQRSVPIDIFEKIKSQQMPDQEKIEKTHYVISTNDNLEMTKKEVEKIVNQISKLEPKAWKTYYISK